MGLRNWSRVRAALQAGDIKTALQYAKVYEAKLIAPVENRINDQP